MGRKLWILGAATAIASSAALLSTPAQAEVYVHIGTPGYYGYSNGYYAQPGYVVQPSYGYGYGYSNHYRSQRGRDSDRDGIPNRYDRDLDNDGRPNHRDWDRDGDGVPNRHDRRPNNPYRY
jgi:hypothetical protein